MREGAMASVQHERLRPFPSFPEVAGAGTAVSGLALRCFGLYESDLSVDFDQTPSPVLVTQLIECCTTSAHGETVNQSVFWNLPVGKRIECLMTLLLAEADSDVTVTFRCARVTCGQESEITISIEELVAIQS